jgi:OOP family OmpA-OmpF porin
MALAALLLASAPAFGQPYLGAGLGVSDTKEFCGRTSVDCDKTGTAWRVFAGYQMNPHFAVEAGYSDFGKLSSRDVLTSATTDFESRAGDVLAVIGWPVGRASLFGKIGAYYGGAKATETTAAGSTLTKEVNGGLTYGLGLRFDVWRNLGIRGDWQRYPKVGGGKLGAEVDVDVFTIGAFWMFR